VNELNKIINSLAIRNIFVLDISQIDKNLDTTKFSKIEYEFLKCILLSSYLEEYKYPVILDIGKIISIYPMLEGSFSQKVEKTILQSRFSFLGTDGLRGKVSIKDIKDPISSFINDNLISPELIEITTYAYSKMLLDSKRVTINSFACIGNDGRDIVTNWKLNSAMIAGYNRAGIRVLDVGVIPTPFIPYKMLKEELHCGSVLTASHNPSNQNGIKFFLDGSKNLPEGLYGDYSFSAWIYKLYIDKSEESHRDEIEYKSLNIEALELLDTILPIDIYQKLKKSILLLDSASGAYFDLSRKFLKRKELNFISIDPAPKGYNINKGCGVAEIEGHGTFFRNEYNNSNTLVKKMFDLGCKSSDPIYGIALDGDGDRGFVLLYNKNDDSVVVLDGDKCGYLIATYLCHTDPKNLNKDFITTVESDIMTSYWASKKLGLNSKIVSVGDKWIGTFKDRDLLLGLESSGHLILPFIFKNSRGKEVSLKSGNGLITTLFTIYAINTLGLDTIHASNPYDEGASHTYYTYFVNKTLFYPSSDIWNKDKDLILSRVKKLDRGYSVEFESKEDSSMLYASIYLDGIVIGSMFCRNSGTEDKIAVYIKCKKEYFEDLKPIAEVINRVHIEKMKNKQKIEYKVESLIINTIKQNKILFIKDIPQLLQHEKKIQVSENDIDSIIYALKKEGRILIENSYVKIK